MKYRKYYTSIKKVWGPLMIVEGVEDVPYGVFTSIVLPDGTERKGQVLAVNGTEAVVQIFEGTGDIDTDHSGIHFSTEPFKVGVTESMKGRILDAYGKPRDGLKPIVAKTTRDINGRPINPYHRTYPHDFIQTGISVIDGLVTLIRGQKLPIFSGAGLPHYDLALEIAKNARLKDDNEKMIVIFVAMGIKHDDAIKFYRSFEADSKLDRVILFFNLADDPPMERLIIPRTALTTAEYFAFEKDYQVLVIMSDITNYCEALREISSAREEVPSRKGYPGYLYSDLASLYERAGRMRGRKGSISQIPILTMPNDDITHPIPDLTGYITEGQIVISRELNHRGIFPPVDILPSLSRLMKDGIGKEYTRADHPHLAAQIYAAYSYSQDVKMISTVIGEEELSPTDRKYLEFSRIFEEKFLDQKRGAYHSMEETLEIAWEALKVLPRRELSKFTKEELDKYYD